MNTKIPRDNSLDSGLALLSEGYPFIASRAQRLNTDIFETRLFLQKAYCVTGADAARMFYQPERFTRRGALPKTTLWLLQDSGSVATLNGRAHLHRKEMFMDRMSPESMGLLVEHMTREWLAAIPRWEHQDRVVLFDALHEILTRAVCAWTGVPLPENEVDQRTRQLSAMIAGAGSAGPHNWYGQLLRQSAERWLRGIVRQARSGQLQPPEGSPLEAFIRHRDLNGKLLPVNIVAVELLNLLRPVVAVARFIVFSSAGPARLPCLRAAHP